MCVVRTPFISYHRMAAAQTYAQRREIATMQILFQPQNGCKSDTENEWTEILTSRMCGALICQHLSRRESAFNVMLKLSLILNRIAYRQCDGDLFWTSFEIIKLTYVQFCLIYSCYHLRNFWVSLSSSCYWLGAFSQPLGNIVIKATWGRTGRFK